jgi:hypothetical protein
MQGGNDTHNRPRLVNSILGQLAQPHTCEDNIVWTFLLGN